MCPVASSSLQLQAVVFSTFDLPQKHYDVFQALRMTEYEGTMTDSYAKYLVYLGFDIENVTTSWLHTSWWTGCAKKDQSANCRLRISPRLPRFGSAIKKDPRVFRAIDYNMFSKVKIRAVKGTVAYMVLKWYKHIYI